jgi:membrane protease YdiL (CAAX protease family)
MSSSRFSLSWTFETPTIVGLAVSLFALPLLAVIPASMVDLGPLPSIAIKWGVAAGVLAIVLGWEGRSLASVGARSPDWWDALWVPATFAIALSAFLFGDPLVEALGLRMEEGALLEGKSVTLALVSAVTAGITEEILFRGYPIERFVEAGFNVYGAGAVTWLLFTLGHLPGYPAGNVLLIAIAGAVFTAVYVWRRTLTAVVGAHILLDVTGVLYAAFGAP